jgi:hypothetical protein
VGHRQGRQAGLNFIEHDLFADAAGPDHCLIVNILLRASKQVDNAGRRERDEYEARKMMGADEDRVDMKR